MKRKSLFVFMLILVALFLNACTVVRGSGNVITVQREVSGFDQVVLSGVGVLHIKVGDHEALEIEAEDNLIPYIESKVQGTALGIGFDDERWDKAFQPTRPIHYYLTVTDLESLKLSGAGRIEVDEIDTAQMRILTSGAGDIEIEKLTAQTLTMDISGSGSCRILDGEIVSQNLRISGAGGYQAADVQSQSTDIDISGLGGAKVWVADSLSVEISGAGSVEYYGQPHVSQEISGAGRIKSLGWK